MKKKKIRVKHIQDSPVLVAVLVSVLVAVFVLVRVGVLVFVGVGMFVFVDENPGTQN